LPHLQALMFRAGAARRGRERRRGAQTGMPGVTQIFQLTDRMKASICQLSNQDDLLWMDRRIPRRKAQAATATEGTVRCRTESLNSRRYHANSVRRIGCGDPRVRAAGDRLEDPSASDHVAWQISYSMYRLRGAPLACCRMIEARCIRFAHAFTSTRRATVSIGAYARGSTSEKNGPLSVLTRVTRSCRRPSSTFQHSPASVGQGLE
jgi:hypothetical protein